MIEYPLTTKTGRNRWFLRSEIDRLLIGSMCFGCGLVVLRMIHAHSLLFVFMIWNLFLAFVPYGLSSWLSRRLDRSLSSVRPLFLMAVCLVWLLFIPNAFYMVTDLYHLHDSRNPRVPEWFDLAMIFSFAWNGLLLGVLSVRQMERLLESKKLASAVFGERFRVPLPFPGGVFVYPVLGLAALGVYTGRYMRYNSWDVLSNPIGVVLDIGKMVVHPLRNQPAWDMILCYTILLSLIYTMLKKLSRALN